MAMQHTKEPWTVELDDFGCCDEADTDYAFVAGMLPVGIIGADGTAVVQFDESSPFWHEDQPEGAVANANAARIVAAANACVGFTTDELTSGIITDLVNVATAALIVRRLQRAYFADRTRENLIASKQSEGDLDRQLTKISAAIARRPIKDAP